MFWMGSRFCKIFYDFQFKHQSWGNSFGLEGNAMPTQKLWLKQVLLTWMVRDEILAKCITAEAGSFTALSTLFCKNAVGIQFTTSFAREPWSLSWKRSALCLLGFFAVFSNFCVSMNREVPGERWSSLEVHILSLISMQHSHRLRWEFRTWINVRIWAFTFRCESVLIVVGKLVMN